VSARQTANDRVSPYDQRGICLFAYMCGLDLLLCCSALWCLLFRVFVVLSIRASVNLGVRVFVVCVLDTVGKGLRLTV